MKNSIFGKKALEKIQTTRRIFLKIAVWILIADFVLGAFLILTESWNVSVGRILGTLFVLAMALFVSINNFICMEKNNRATQTFALISFVSNIIWLIFALLLMWEIVPFYLKGEGVFSSSYHLSFFSLTMFISIYAAIAGFCISNTLSIKEPIKIIKPLKITAVVCVMYLWFFETFATIVEFQNLGTLLNLTELAVLAFIITASAASIISKTSEDNKDKKRTSGKTSKSDEELRAEIEEKVRREMIEKEIRSKIEAEQSGLSRNTEIKTKNN
jgi:hypothetical protein